MWPSSDEDDLAPTDRASQPLCDGLKAQVVAHKLVMYSAEAKAIPLINFADDMAFERVNLWTCCAAEPGVYVHPWDNWFICAAHNDDLDHVLLATDAAFTEVCVTFETD